MIFITTHEAASNLGAVSYTHLDVYKRQLHDFAAQGAIDTISAIIQDFENGIEIFSCLGQFETFANSQNLIGENAKIKNLKQIEPSLNDFSGMNCISQLKSLGLDDQKYDLIIANSGLNFVNDLPGLLIKIKNALNENGVFIGSFIGNNLSLIHI